MGGILKDLLKLRAHLFALSVLALIPMSMYRNGLMYKNNRHNR